MGFRCREKYVLLAGLAVLALIYISSLSYLPSDDEATVRSRQWIRARENREKAQSFDRMKFFEKVEKAKIAAPPLSSKTVKQRNATEFVDDDQTSLAYRRDFVRNMVKFAWESYHRYAWGANELRPLSRTGHSASIFASGNTGATIVDSVDTLFIMGLLDEYEQARAWIENNLDFKKASGDISVFETNIRFIGGLLAAYALTNDKMFVKKATEIADLLLPAFNTPTGVPLAIVNVQTGTPHNWGWASGGCSILAEFGCMHLEFIYLSQITNNTVYAKKVNRVREVISSLEKPDGLYPNYLNPKTGKWGQKHVSVGALGDSFYEYLLKSWLFSNKQDSQAKKLYDDAVVAIEKQLLKYSKQNNLAYFAEMKGNRVEHKMDHLACFIAGMYALEVKNEEKQSRRSAALKIAVEIADTCHESYNRSAIGIGPESFRFTSDAEAISISDREKYYIQRPEVIEGWFYLWRVTHDPKYREWCWEAAQAIEKYCRTPNGYSGIRDVYKKEVEWDDVQQSFIIAETFKYLFLVFSDDDVMALSEWVFNTEGHAFPISP